MHWILKRLLLAIPLFLGMTLLSFLLIKLSPGDPSLMMMDPNISSVDLEALRQQHAQGQPIIGQYISWLGQLLQGNFGFSLISKQPVLEAIMERLPATLILSLSSLTLILVITFPLGLWSGYKKGSRFDNIVTLLTFIGLSLPTFWIGLMCILFFSLKLNLFPSSGFLDAHLMEASLFSKSLNILHHLALPLLTILVGGLASLTRYHRFGIIQILVQDYVKAARARGISESRILYVHAFKNAALPLITILGLSLPGLIGGSFVIEYIFAWPGLGQLGLSAVFARDYPLIMGTLVFSSALIIIGNLAADIAYQYVDPRIKKI